MSQLFNAIYPIRGDAEYEASRLSRSGGGYDVILVYEVPEGEGYSLIDARTYMQHRPHVHVVAAYQAGKEVDFTTALAAFEDDTHESLQRD